MRHSLSFSDTPENSNVEFADGTCFSFAKKTNAQYCILFKRPFSKGARPVLACLKITPSHHAMFPHGTSSRKWERCHDEAGEYSLERGQSQLDIIRLGQFLRIRLDETGDPDSIAGFYRTPEGGICLTQIKIVDGRLLKWKITEKDFEVAGVSSLVFEMTIVEEPLKGKPNIDCDSRVRYVFHAAKGYLQKHLSLLDLASVQRSCPIAMAF